MPSTVRLKPDTTVLSALCSLLFQRQTYPPDTPNPYAGALRSIDIACAVQIAVTRRKCQSKGLGCQLHLRGVQFASATVVKRTMFSVALVGLGVAALGGFETGDGVPKPPEKEWAARNDALARASVFRVQRFDASTIDFALDPNRNLVNPALTTCKYRPHAVSGTTAKFDCELPNLERIKVKYGWTKEIPSEIAATRLLDALGFGADRVSRVETVRCYGCPFQPFHTRGLIALLGIEGYFDKRINYSSYRDFDNVSVERNLEGKAIEVGYERGWAFHELDTIDPSRGGATRAEVDALRLMAVFLHHWDNKSSNQRLTCTDSKTADCTHPLAMIHDVGSAFGPKKAELAAWKSKPVWFGDRAKCLVSMKGMPYNGGTFEDIQISEGGRKLLADRLRQLSPKQIETLFTAAGLEDAAEWTAAFQDRVRQIADRPACPATTKISS